MKAPSASSDLAQVLRNDLALGAIGIGEALPSLRQLARQHGCTLAVAHAAIRRLEQDGIVECHPRRGLVLQRRPPAGRGGLHIGYLNLSGLLGEARPRSIMQEILEAGRSEGVECTVASCRNQVDYVVQAAAEMQAAAVILGGIPERSTWLALQQAGYPVVVDGDIQNQDPCEDVTMVWHDDHGAFRLSIEHLVAIGHRRLALLGIGNIAKPVSRWQALRLDGWLTSLRDCGVDAAAVPIGAIRGSLPEDWVAAAAALLATDPAPTAIAVECDWIAWPVYEAARRLGRRIPDDLSLIAPGDGSAGELPGPLTTCMDRSQRGAIFYRQIRRVLSGAPALVERIPARLCRQGSTRSLHSGEVLV